MLRSTASHGLALGLLLLGGCGERQASESSDGERASAVARNVRNGSPQQTTEQKLKALLPAAAGMDMATFDRLTTTGRPPDISQFDDQSLTMVFMTHKWGPEHQHITALTVTELANFITQSRSDEFVSIIQHAAIKGLSVTEGDDAATGKVTFVIADKVEVQAEFAASRNGGNWRIDRLAVPDWKMQTARDEEGRWKAKPID